MTLLADVLTETRGFVRAYVVLTDEQADVIALWVAHAHALDAFDVSPPLAVTSPEKRSGKTRLLDALELLVPRPWRAISPSEPVVYRKLEADESTLLLDEVDSIFGRAREQTEGLRALLNAGNQRGTRVPRCTGASFEIREFSVFSAKVLSGIGALPDTIADRSIPIEMRRRTKQERVARFRRRVVAPEAVAIRDALADWADLAVEDLHEALDVVSHLADDGRELASLDDRRFEQAFEPLLAVAHLAGDGWLERAVKAAVVLSDAEEGDDPSIRVRLLADVYSVFTSLTVDRITSHQLVNTLTEDESSPWADWAKGRPITPTAVAKLLSGYHIHPKVIKLADGTTARGYLRKAFEDAWRRYTPPPAVTDVTTAVSSQNEPDSGRNQNGAVTPAEKAANPHRQAIVTPVTAESTETRT